MPWTLDRRAGAVALAVSAAVVLPLLALTESPLPEHVSTALEAAVNDPEAVSALSRLAELGGEGSWLVEYETERSVTGGASRTGRVIAATVPPSSVVTDGETLEATIDARSYSCARLDTGPICSEGEPRTEGAPDIGAVVAGVAGTDRYAVSRAEGRSIAGEPADCFELDAAEEASLPGGMVREAVLCYAVDGVLLSARVATGTATDGRTALRVERDIDRRDLIDLLDGFDAPAPPDAG